MAIYDVNGNPLYDSGNDYPEYLVTETETVLGSLVPACTDKAYLFTVITDSHNDRNSVAAAAWRDAVAAMGYIYKKYSSDAIIHMGDILQGVVSASTMKNDLIAPVADMRAITPNVFLCRGNHESDFAYDNPNHTELISTDELYAITARQNEQHVVRPGNKLYYYVDYGTDLRCVFLDSYMLGYGAGETTADLRQNPDRARYGYGSEQITWFSTVALNTSRQVAVFSHMSASTSNMSSDSWWTDENKQSFNDIRDAAKAFITNGGVLVGWFYGHIHTKKKSKLSAAGFTELGLRNSFYTSMTTGGVHSIPNFSLVAIKPDKRRVDVISFGQDANDSFTY